MKTLPTPKQQILDLLDTLSPEDLQRVLHFIQTMHGERPKGIPGDELIAFFNQFEIKPEEAEAMTKIMDEIEQWGAPCQHLQPGL